MIDRTTPVPPSRQIANAIRAQIESGELPPDTRIPSVISLASEHGVSPDTARKAVRILRDEGLVVVVAGYGTFVASRG
jgi:GntR family transcriptional regulator